MRASSNPNSGEKNFQSLLDDFQRDENGEICTPETCEDYTGFLSDILRDFPTLQLALRVKSAYSRANLFYTGIHKCMSGSSIGHRCTSYGMYFSHAEAYANLQKQDCCPHTKDGGASVEFGMGGGVTMPERAWELILKEPASFILSQ